MGYSEEYMARQSDPCPCLGGEGARSCYANYSESTVDADRRDREIKSPAKHTSGASGTGSTNSTSGAIHSQIRPSRLGIEAGAERSVSRHTFCESSSRDFTHCGRRLDSRIPYNACPVDYHISDCAVVFKRDAIVLADIRQGQLTSCVHDCRGADLRPRVLSRHYEYTVRTHIAKPKRCTLNGVMAWIYSCSYGGRLPIQEGIVDDSCRFSAQRNEIRSAGDYCTCEVFRREDDDLFIGGIRNKIVIEDIDLRHDPSLPIYQRRRFDHDTAFLIGTGAKVSFLVVHGPGF